MESMIGSVLGARYRILEKIGEGGMGEVYRAEHLLLMRTEAIKVLRVELASDPTFVARFRREARATNRVQHPNIIGVYDFGQLPDGRVYLAMEYAVGRGVDAELARHGTFDVPRAVHVLVQLADAMHHAHECGVVHRDLKPANLILVEHRGQRDWLKVLDFGIAKIVCPEYKETVALTRAGEVFGTPAYMAPEQLQATGCDARSDIYSVGCIAYELLTGSPPFSGRRLQLMHAHLTKEPEPLGERAHRNDIPRMLESVVLQCMAKDPAARFQTGHQLATALAQVPGYSGPKATRATRITLRASWPIEFHDEDTFADMSHSALGGAETASASTDELRDILFLVVRDLSEALVDNGVGDQNIVLGVARTRALADDLERVDAERVALEQQFDTRERASREREASLRFALGELQFDRERATPDLAADLSIQIRELEARLSELLRSTSTEIERLTDTGIDLAASQSSIEDQLAAHCNKMRLLVDNNLALLARDPALSAIVHRYRAITRVVDAASD